MRFLILILAFVLAACKSTVVEPGEGSIVEPGDAVPAFEAGGFRSPDDFIGRKSLVVLFNTGCRDCQRELPVIAAACRELPELQAVGFARAQTVTDWEYEGIVPYSDPYMEIYSLFAERTIPRVYLVDERGTVVWMAVESVPENLKQTIIKELEL